MNTKSVTPLADSILYLLSLLRARSRPIDRYIDYFGEDATAAPALRRRRRAGPAT